MDRQSTGIAAEFWFFSQLKRLVYEAYITLGNTKRIDITVRLNDGETLSFDVKGKRTFRGGSFQYLGDKDKIVKSNHFFTFVNLNTRKHKTNTQVVRLENEVTCYIVHSENIDKIARTWKPKNGKSSGGFGFEAKLLWYLKERNEKHITTKNKKEFKLAHNIDDIDFNEYGRLIMCLNDFEEKYCLKK